MSLRSVARNFRPLGALKYVRIRASNLGKGLMALRTSTSPVRRGRGLLKPVAPALVALVSSAIVVGVSSASDRAATSSPPATVTATQMPPSRSPTFLQPGKIVNPSALGVRAFINSNDGVALNQGMSLGGVTYPVATVNGGRTWRIDGPELHIPAANAPNVVTQVGAGAPATYFAYGGPGGANSVAVTGDGGKHWYRAYLGGGIVAAVVDSNRKLYAFTGAPGDYYSTNGGRVWHYSASVF